MSTIVGLNFTIPLSRGPIKIQICSMKFLLKSQRHLTLVWATSCVSRRPPPCFYGAPCNFEPPSSSLGSLHLWRAIEIPHISISPRAFTRWQSSPQCLRAAGICSKGGESHVIYLHGAHVISSEGIKSSMSFPHVPDQFNYPALSQLELNAHHYVWLCGNPGGGGQGPAKPLNIKTLELLYIANNVKSIKMLRANFFSARFLFRPSTFSILWKWHIGCSSFKRPHLMWIYS